MKVRFGGTPKPTLGTSVLPGIRESSARPGIYCALPVRRGEFVAMRGYLVTVGGPDGFYWNTSLRRDDTGNGACEVFYVESVEAKAELELLAHAR